MISGVSLILTGSHHKLIPALFRGACSAAATPAPAAAVAQAEGKADPKTRKLAIRVRMLDLTSVIMAFLNFSDDHIF